MENPHANYRQASDWADQQRYQRAQAFQIPMKVITHFVDYMETVQHDTEAMLWGWTYAEHIGLAYWRQRDAEWKLTYGY